MGTGEFTEVDGADAVGAMKDATIGENVAEAARGNSEAETEHVYITFNEGTSIEDGISAIQKNILLDTAINISRKDETGNAVVIIVTSAQRKEIEKLEVVKSVKVIEEAHLLTGAETAKKKRLRRLQCRQLM